MKPNDRILNVLLIIILFAYFFSKVVGDGLAVKSLLLIHEENMPIKNVHNQIRNMIL